MVRDRYVTHGLHEDITIVNHSSAERAILLELTFHADFADVFEVYRGRLRKVERTSVEPREGQHLSLVYRRKSFHRETWITFSNEPTVVGRRAAFEITLEPKETWKTCVTILPVVEEAPPSMRCADEVLGPPFGPYRPEERPLFEALVAEKAHRPLEDVPKLKTDHAGLQQGYDQAVADLRALLVEEEPEKYILAAGRPWYMAVFGRDSIISAIQTKLLGPDLMVGTLHTLAGLQATVRDNFRDAQPGKLPHEVRKGELSVLEEVPHSHYYGSVDVTPLFLVLLHEAYFWTGDEALLHRFLPAAEAALDWIDRYGDLDGDGFVEYRRRSRKGLRNQGWKDSDDAVTFADGSLAEGSIALAEVQGYVFDAKRRMAHIYHALGNPERGRTLEREAHRLRRRFNKAFWMPEQGYYAVALDGRKRQVDGITSNPGHCLWSGIVDDDKAPKVAERLVAPDMFNGWGIRTLSSDMARYNPETYHNGSVWPHDNSIIAAGLARYGFAEEANLVAAALIEASAGFPDHRLPELFAGYPRREYSVPVPYPTAHSPQAWASGAVIHLLETFLGLQPTGDRLLQEAPREGLSVSLSGVQYRGSLRVL